MPTLPFTAHTASERLLELELELHPDTRDAADVGALVERLMAAISDHVQSTGNSSDGDVLQALVLTAAVRLAVMGVPAGVSRELMAQLVDQALVTAASAHNVETH